MEKNVRDVNASVISPRIFLFPLSSFRIFPRRNFLLLYQKNYANYADCRIYRCNNAIVSSSIIACFFYALTYFSSRYAYVLNRRSTNDHLARIESRPNRGRIAKDRHDVLLDSFKLYLRMTCVAYARIIRILGVYWLYVLAITRGISDSRHVSPRGEIAESIRYLYLHNRAISAASSYTHTS